MLQEISPATICNFTLHELQDYATNVAEACLLLFLILPALVFERMPGESVFMIKAVAIDDEPLALEVIDTFCKRFDFLSLEKTFTDTAGAMKYLEKNLIDLLFLDINYACYLGCEFLQIAAA